MPNLFKNAIVQKRNILNELRATNLTLQELRFFTIYLSKINPYDKSTKDVIFPLEDYKKIMGYDKISLQHLKASAKSLLQKIVNIPLESGGFRQIVLFDELRVDKDNSGEWYVEISASQKALPLMFDFKDRYFKYALWNALRLKSANQIRMYEILKQYETIGKREIKVSDLRELLGIAPNEYPRWNNFKAKVLDSCQQALKDTTDICFTYERGKTGTGGKWLTIIFHISKNTPQNSQLTLFEQELEATLHPQTVALFAGMVEPPAQESQQLNLLPDEQSNSNTDFYSGACDDEFTAVEIESLIAVINTMELPQHEMGAAFARYHYLLEQYTRFKAIAERTAIKNRYSYFYTMLVSDRDKQRAGDEP